MEINVSFEVSVVCTVKNPSERRGRLLRAYNCLIEPARATAPNQPVVVRNPIKGSRQISRSATQVVKV